VILRAAFLGRYQLYEEKQRGRPGGELGICRNEDSVIRQKNIAKRVTQMAPAVVPESIPLWQLDFAELTGHNLEARGREEVNRLLQAGWRLLHIYTLKYEEDGVWRERPMAILGRLRNKQLELVPS
jgi:hypothetical protein